MNFEDFKKQNNNPSEHFWYKARKELISKIFNIFVKNNNNKILEIGCGVGYNFDLLEKFGQVEGFDNDENVVRVASKNNLNIKHSSIEKFDMPDNYYDVICCFDVLEHIEDDNQALHKIKKGLKKGGFLLFTVPAFPGIFSNHDIATGHKRRYTKKDLSNKLLKNDFEILAMSYWNIVFFPLIFITRKAKNIFLKKENAENFQTDIKKTNKTLNKILFYLLKLESKLPVYLPLPYGLTIYGVAKK